MKKNPHNKILKGEPKEQHLSTVPKFCSFLWKYWKNFLTSVCIMSLQTWLKRNRKVILVRIQDTGFQSCRSIEKTAQHMTSWMEPVDS